MKRSKLLRLLVVLACVVGSFVQAGEAVVSGPIQFIGDGCPYGSSEALVTEDGKTVSLLFEKFTVEAGAVSKRSYVSKVCEMRVPLSVSSNYKLKVKNLDHRGYYFLGSRFDEVVGKFETRILSRKIMRSSGVNSLRSRGPSSGDFFYEPARSVTSHACGGPMELRVLVRLTARSLSCKAGTQATYALDSIDFSTLPETGDVELIPCK